MKKRQFLGAAIAGALPLAADAAAADRGPASRGPASRGPALLTVTGAIARANRGPFDPVLDQMMHKQGLGFAKAYTFDHAALLQLVPHTIRPTLEYDGKPHTLRGPLLLDVMGSAGAKVGDRTTLVLRAVDGYSVELNGAQAGTRRVIVATHIDGAPMPLGGLGPLWAVYDADRIPEMAALPLAQRFTDCPWALYHIEVRA
ncbi:molybdopterin-dependent oxidoreductase [Massilia phyllosphaerae]|uniref:molybdopterin-dependent oxidoreductase n=1 Tax=Massilia phyllosphaerae TaxID=3106034 RepID=UPI002B1CD4F2|nr:molybdopterin-dependent oxidoreductase [Massilia sp. SGZ-792]